MQNMKTSTFIYNLPPKRLKLPQSKHPVFVFLVAMNTKEFFLRIATDT